MHERTILPAFPAFGFACCPGVVVFACFSAFLPPFYWANVTDGHSFQRFACIPPRVSAILPPPMLVPACVWLSWLTLQERLKEFDDARTERDQLRDQLREALAAAAALPPALPSAAAAAVVAGGSEGTVREVCVPFCRSSSAFLFCFDLPACTVGSLVCLVHFLCAVHALPPLAVYLSAGLQGRRGWRLPWRREDKPC